MNKAGFATVNPSTGEEIEAFSYFTPAQTEKVVAQADKSFQSFRELPVHKRAQLFTELGNTLRKNKAQLAKVISTEMGKIFSEAEAEIEKCAHEAGWYAEHGPKIMADEPASTGTVNAYVSYLPLGPILAIMPWNFPIWQLTRMAIPTMLAGNVVLVKHSSNTQRSSLEFERVMLEAGFPEGVFQNLILKRDDVVNVINDGRVQGASVTGSVRAGSAVASKAGKVIKKNRDGAGRVGRIHRLRRRRHSEGCCGWNQGTVPQRRSGLSGCKTLHSGREDRRRIRTVVRRSRQVSASWRSFQFCDGSGADGPSRPS